MPMGAIPKEIDRIAKRIGETVGKELLTHEDIARTLSSESFRGRFDEALRDALDSLLDRELGSLRDLVTPEQAAGLEQALDRLARQAPAGARDLPALAGVGAAGAQLRVGAQRRVPRATALRGAHAGAAGRPAQRRPAALGGGPREPGARARHLRGARPRDRQPPRLREAAPPAMSRRRGQPRRVVGRALPAAAAGAARPGARRSGDAAAPADRRCGASSTASSRSSRPGSASSGGWSSPSGRWRRRSTRSSRAGWRRSPRCSASRRCRSGSRGRSTTGSRSCSTARCATCSATSRRSAPSGCAGAGRPDPLHLPPPDDRGGAGPALDGLLAGGGGSVGGRLPRPARRGAGRRPLRPRAEWIVEALRGPRAIGFLRGAIEHQTAWLISVPSADPATTCRPTSSTAPRRSSSTRSGASSSAGSRSRWRGCRSRDGGAEAEATRSRRWRS
jgi:hypothetical protein